MIYQRAGSPFWYFNVPDPKAPRGRRRRSTKTTNEKAAQRIAAKALAEIENPQTTKEDRTLAQALDDYVANLRADGKATWAEDCEWKIRKLLGQTRDAKRFKLDGAMLLKDLSPRHIRELKLARAREGCGPSTIASELRVLRAACYRAAAEGYMVGEIGKWSIPPTRMKLRYLTPEEAARLLRELDPERVFQTRKDGSPVPVAPHVKKGRQDAYDLTVSFLMTGCRWSELATLAPGQVDLAKRVITVKGKGNKTREVPLVPEALAVMQKRMATHRVGYLFPGVVRKDERGKRVDVRAGPSRAITRAMDAAGLNDPETVASLGRANLHTLRHTYASWLRQRGMGLDELQHLLGHSSLQMTMRYAKLDNSSTAEKVGQKLSGLLQTADDQLRDTYDGGAHPI